MTTALPPVCVADCRFPRLSAALGAKRQPAERDQKQPLRQAPWQMRNSPALKSCLELEAASEQAAAQAVSRTRSLLHSSVLAPGALSLRQKATEAATVRPPPPCRYGPRQQDSPLGSVLGWQLKAIHPYGNVGTRQPL